MIILHISVNSVTEMKSQMKSQTEMVDLLDSEEFECRFSCGFGLPGSSFRFTDKHRLVNNICKHFTDREYL